MCVYSEHNTSGQTERGRSSGPALGKAFGMSWGENGELQVVGLQIGMKLFPQPHYTLGQQLEGKPISFAWLEPQLWFIG